MDEPGNERRAADGWKIYRDGVLVTTVSPTATSYTITGLGRSSSYTVSVVATSAQGDAYTTASNSEVTWFKTGLLF